MLKRLHGALRLLEDARDLCVCEAEQELERQHLALFGREPLDQLEQREANT